MTKPKTLSPSDLLLQFQRIKRAPAGAATKHYLCTTFHDLTPPNRNDLSCAELIAIIEPQLMAAQGKAPT